MFLKFDIGLNLGECYPLQHYSAFPNNDQINNKACFCAECLSDPHTRAHCADVFWETELLISTFLNMKAHVRRSARTPTLGGQSSSCSGCVLLMWSLSKQTVIFHPASLPPNATRSLTVPLFIVTFSWSSSHFLDFSLLFFDPLSQFPIQYPFRLWTLCSRYLTFPLLDESEIDNVGQQQSVRGILVARASEDRITHKTLGNRSKSAVKKKKSFEMSGIKDYICQWVSEHSSDSFPVPRPALTAEQGVIKKMDCRERFLAVRLFSAAP